MKKKLSRREVLKLGGLALGGLALAPALPKPGKSDPVLPGFTPAFPRPEEYSLGKLGRVTIDQINVRARPNDQSAIVGNRFRDQLVHLYEDVIPPDAPAYYNRLWYRVWGGYLHSAYLQIVDVRLNEPLGQAPESGLLCEVTVPYTTAYQYDQWKGWHPWQRSRLYYQTTHWITGIQEGPDGGPWYQITSEIDDFLKYYAPAAHLRPIPPEEIAPISSDVPANKKLIKVSLGEQRLRAYEYDQEVFSTLISSGIPSRSGTPSGLSTATPHGTFYIYSKMPNKHMGAVTGNPDADSADTYALPGVPWTSFFKEEGGYAFHGTYWHNNFGLQMSHGCVNMRNADAKWLFRWTTPVFDTDIKSHADWERTGRGTRVEIS